MIRTAIQHCHALIVAVVFSLVSVSAQATWEEAGAVIEGTTSDMLLLLENEELLLEEQEGQLIAEIDTVLSPVVDFDYISKLVMGKYYRKASKDQRVAFSAVFKTTLLKTYAKALLGFQIKTYAMVPPKRKSPDKRKQIVTVDVFAADGTKFSIVYYMKKKEEGWRLVNALLDGINLRLTFKNQFAEMVQKNRGDVGAVIDHWKEKVDPGKSEA
ncbi:MAG: ABC transporter substrate-binding protein [Neptuniibacter sp.]|nr:ABC transporter substrate-binding protein [Neptuniibacter sp.]